MRNRAIILNGDPVCFYCKRAPATTADHYIPVKRGGTHALDNLVPACWRCNRIKSDQMPWQFTVPQPLDKTAPGDW